MDPRKAQETVEKFVEFLRERQGRITEEWIEAVQRDGRLQTAERFSVEELKNHLPLLFENLAAMLKTPANHATQSEAYESARSHGMHRFGQGYRINELLREIARIRLILIDHMLEFETQTPEFTDVVKRVVFQRLHGFLDELVSDSTGQFTNAEQAQLRQGVREARDECVATESRNQELQKIDASRLRLLRTAAHELRNNVNAAQLSVQELLEMGAAADEDQRSLIQSLARQITRMGELLRDLLDYSVILDKRMESLRPERVSPDELCEELAAMYAPIADAKGLIFKCDYAPALGPLTTDRTKLLQIANNLLSNAVKYTNSGEVRLGLQAADDEYWAMSVEDTGPGIAPADRERLFTEFHRAQKTSHQQGTGLGLSIVKRLTELLGGEIRVDSEPGKGSRFEVLLPMRANAAAPASV